MEGVGWSTEEKGQPRKRGGQMSGMITSIKGQRQKPRRALKGPKHAVAAAKLVVSQRRRRPLVVNARQAKMENGYCGIARTSGGTCTNRYYVAASGSASEE